jgi:hypothetical protein
VGDVLHGVPHGQRAVAAVAERLALGPLDEGVGVHEGGQGERDDHREQDAARGLLARAGPRAGRAAAEVGGGHQNWK